MGVEHFAGLGRSYPTLGADQQLLLHFCLQRHQLLAQRRLGDVQHIGGLGHAADIDNLHEVLEAAQVHWRVLGQSV
ncbi:hypothetical protein D3C76_1053420 [compost metagenome]